MSEATQGLSGVNDMAEKILSGANTAAPSQDVGSLLGTMSMTTIIISIIAGLIGSAYFVYGRKTSSIPMLCSGVALCIVPYFIGNTILLLTACIAMVVAPFAIERYA